MSTKSLIWMGTVLASMLLIIGGWLKWNKARDELQTSIDLLNIEQAYMDCFVNTSKPPSKVEDLQLLATERPQLYRKIQGGVYVVVWNINPNEQQELYDKVVLAYEKDVPTKGGWAIRGGALIRLTAEEYQTSLKLPEKE